MAEGTRIIEAPTEEAQNWLRYSLEQGFDVSVAVLDAGLINRGQGLAIVSDEFQRIPIRFLHGGVLNQRLSEERLGRLLNEMFPTAKSVLVEDNLREKGGLHVAREGQPAAFMGDHVVHWCDLAQGSTAAVDAIVKGASGYPTNAFVLAKSSTNLGLVDREDAPENLAHEALSSLLGVIVSAFDDESFLIWVPDELSPRAL